MSTWSQFSDYVTTADHWWGTRGIIHRTTEHLRVSGASMLAAAAIALPAAVVLGHVKRGGLLAQSIVNVGRAVPSLAIVALLFPLSLRYGFGLGFWPTFGAMLLLGIPPMFTNAYAGVRDVDPAVVEASRGMGMRAREVLWLVEVPAASPLILTGVRVAALQVVATATLGAFVGFNGLGSFVDEGITQQDDAKLLTGALLVALVALLIDAVFGVLTRAATPWLRARRDLPSRALALDVTLAPDPLPKGNTP